MARHSYLFLQKRSLIDVDSVLPRMYRLGLWSFYKGVLSDDNLPKTTTFEWFQKWSSYTGLTVAQILLRLVLLTF